MHLHKYFNEDNDTNKHDTRKNTRLSCELNQELANLVVKHAKGYTKIIFYICFVTEFFFTQWTKLSKRFCKL